MDKKRLKYLSLSVLVIQNSALILMMRYTRASVPSDKLYLASTAVLMSEVVKTLISLLVIYYLLPQQKRSITKLLLLLKVEIFVKWKETIKLAFPAILYIVQNNLQYVAATNLDAATFQVTYQLKILTTAFFTVLLLNRTLTRTQWTSLGLLTIGIGLVALPKETIAVAGNRTHGLLAVVAACSLSGLAGVYFEKIVKTDAPPILYSQDRHTALWIRNIQLSIFSVLLGGLSLVTVKGGFFQHYTGLTWVVILIQAGGGLIVALVVRYADNILKGFATSLSIVVSSWVSVWLFQFEPTWVFDLGVVLVVLATYLYGLA